MNSIMMSAAEIAARINGRIICGNPDKTISSIAGIREAGPEQLSFIGNKKYEHQLESSRAGIVLIPEDMAESSSAVAVLITCRQVDYAVAVLLEAFAEKPPEPPRSIHPSAVIDASAEIGAGVHIGAHVVIEAGAEISDGATIMAGTYIGNNVKIGAGTLIYPNVTVMYRSVIGGKCIIHSGVVIGADGFGFVPGPSGLVKVPQTGYVEIGDDVEIGANTTIDRARFGRTWIKNNVKIDDQVMVAHNVVIGESSILVAQAGIAGSAELGRGVIIAAKAGVNGHIIVGDGTKLAGTSGLVKSCPPGSVMLGTPAVPQRDFMARFTVGNRLDRLVKKVNELAARIEEMRKQ